MFGDARLRDTLHDLLREIDVPPLAIDAIQRKILQAQPVRRQRRFVAALFAAAAGATLVLALPSVSPGLVPTLESRIAEVLQWTAPPPAPPFFAKAMHAQVTDLATAQRKVRFTIVSPSGLPSDIASSKLSLSPTADYSVAPRTWRIARSAITFSYRRSDGRSFELTADSVASQDAPPSKYMFEDRGTTKDGREILVKHLRFAWRNGDQIMTAIAGEGLSGAEITTIRSAMRGIPIPGVWPPAKSAHIKMIRIPTP